VNVITIDNVAPLPGPGLVVGRATLESKREALRAFTAATLRAMEEIIADPQRGLAATFARVPELAVDPDTQLAVLKATVEAWQSDTTRASGLGSIDMETWKSALDIMTSLPDSVVVEPPTLDQLVTEQLLP
jgi:ABC-type nitrate/sulfonate/bicarbonate transport system substrate-binding protein